MGFTLKPPTTAACDSTDALSYDTFYTGGFYRCKEHSSIDSKS